MLPGQPSVRQRAARRVDGAFDPVLSEARNLLQAAIPHAKKKLRRLRSVREAGALLASSAIEIGARFGPAGHWHKRACTACNLKRLHSVVAELLKAAGQEAPPMPGLNSGEGGETSSDEEVEAWASAPQGCARKTATGKRRRTEPAAGAPGAAPGTLRLRQSRGPPLACPVFALEQCPSRVVLGRLQLRLELVSGPEGEKPLFAPGHDGTLRYGGGHELRIGRAPCSSPDGNNVQLKGSPKVSRKACAIAWDDAASRFCLTDLSAGGVVIDGRKAGPRTPLDDGATLAFFGNPQWHVGYRPPGPIPPEVFVFALRSVPPSSAPRWEVASPLVSREHCALEYDAQRGSIIVTELGSTFGTAVDGVSLAVHQQAVLRPGGELVLGASLADADDVVDPRVLGFLLEQES